MQRFRATKPPTTNLVRLILVSRVKSKIILFIFNELKDLDCKAPPWERLRQQNSRYRTIDIPTKRPIIPSFASAGGVVARRLE
jgi:hypothetical protein